MEGAYSEWGSDDKTFNYRIQRNAPHQSNNNYKSLLQALVIN
jgi:hypothetical protein